MTEVPGLDVAGLTALARRRPPRPRRRAADGERHRGRSEQPHLRDRRRPRCRSILRRPPLGHVLSSAHDMRREHRVISALARSAVPGAASRSTSSTTPPTHRVTGTVFFLMERAPGEVLAHPAQNARLHAAPGSARSASSSSGTSPTCTRSIPPRSGSPTSAARTATSRASSRPGGGSWTPRARARRRCSTRCRRAWATACRHPARSGIVHGDFRLDNALVVGAGDEPHISAILDWEMATLGDPFVDLGIFALYWDIAEPPRRFAGAVPSAVDPAAGYPVVRRAGRGLRAARRHRHPGSRAGIARSPRTSSP